MSESNTPDPQTPETLEEVAATVIKAQPQGIRRGIRPRTAKRLGIMGVVLAGLIGGFYWFIGLKGDLQLGSDTSTMISAMKLNDQGSQAVVIDPQGEVTESANFSEGKSDRDLAWDPKGNRLFFISDRKDESFHIYRWDPQRNSVDQKSIDKAGRSNLSFDIQDDGAGELVGLVLVRGTVQEFRPKTAESQQVMPPTKKAIADQGSGSSSTFEMIYKRFGQSFRAARWFGNRRYIAAVMRREDRGESLIIQDSEPDEKGTLRPPQIVFVAEKINLAVDPKTGNLVFSITDVLPIPSANGTPTLGEDGKEIKYGFVHALFRLDSTANPPKLEVIGSSPQKDVSFSSPVVSPDGASIMFLVSKYLGEGSSEVMALEQCPLTAGGIQSHTTLTTGSITDPCFSPDGRKIAYVKREGSHQSIFIASSDGSSAKNLTGSSGDFASPAFSPQYN